MIRLGVGLPCYGSKLDVGHAAMWLGLGVALASTQDKFALRMFADYHVNGIELCRNTVVFDAIEAGCDWVLMVDHDTFHASKVDAIGDAGVDVLQMIMDGERRDAALIGAPVRGRQVDNPAICVQTRVGDAWRAVSLAEVQGRVLDVERIGAAFIAVNLTWLRTCWPNPPWFAMTYNFTGRPRYQAGEDYFVCDGVRARGGTVLCDGRFVPEHVAGRKLVEDVESTPRKP